MSIRCICLIRVSTAHQDFEGQKKVVVANAIADGYKKSEIEIVEAKESAIKLKEEERETLNEMKGLIAKNKTVEAVYVFAIDRLARKVSVILSVKDYLLERNINLVFVNPHKMATLRKDEKGNLVEDELTSMLLMFLSYGAEMEMKLKQERFKAARETLKAQGKVYYNKTVFGYTRNPKTKEADINEEEAYIIRYVYNNYLKGMTMQDIYTNLVSMGKLPHKSKVAARGFIWRILHNEAYKGGQSFYNKNSVFKFKAIIDEETFEAAQKKLADNKWTYEKTKFISFGKGLLYCVNEKRIMSPIVANKCYKCMKGEKYSLNINVIDSLLWHVAKQVYRFIIIERQKNNNELYESKKKEITEQIDNIDKIIASIEDKERKAFVLYLDGKVSQEIYEEQMNKIKSEKENYLFKKSSLNSELTKYKIQTNEFSNIYGNDIDLDELDDQDKRNIILETINRVNVENVGVRSYELRFDLKSILAQKQYDNIVFIYKTNQCKISFRMKNLKTGQDINMYQIVKNRIGNAKTIFDKN